MDSTLTKRQKQILDYLESFIKKHDYPPSLQETARHFKLSSPSTIHQHINALELKGYLSTEDNQARSIKVYGKGKVKNQVTLPLLGIIAAGKPIETCESPESVTVSKSLLTSHGKHYALKVKGNSMLNDGIVDGDIVIIKEQPTAENGETIVALLDNDKATLKRLYIEKNGYRLQPANPAVKPIYTKELTIQGKVISVIRDFRKPEQDQFSAALPKPSKDRLTKQDNINKYLNKVFCEDILTLLKKLPDKSVHMIFGDPDYNVGIKYGDKTYTKNFNEYIKWYTELTKESMRVLKDDGNLFMMNYPKQNAHLRVKYLDDRYPLISEYVWVYNTNVGHSPKRFTTAHRTILHVRKQANSKFYKDNVALPYKNPTDRRIRQNLKNGSKGRMPYSWFYHNLVKNVSKEKTLHACQIPQQLTEMLIKSSTLEGDIVLVLFGGSGSELEICKLLKRQYISAELDKKYCEMISDRLKNGYIRNKYKLGMQKASKQEEPAQALLF